MKPLVGKLRLCAIVLIAIGHLIVTDRINASPRYEDCDEFCDLEADCEEPCWGPVEGEGIPLLTNCWAYSEATEEMACAYPDWSTCNYLCSYGGSGSTSCEDNGGATTCGSYGIYLSCGDSVCAADAGENPTNCSADCGADIEATEPEVLDFVEENEDVFESPALEAAVAVSEAASSVLAPPDDEVLSQTEAQAAINDVIPDIEVVNNQKYFKGCESKERWIRLTRNLIVHNKKIKFTVNGVNFWGALDGWVQNIDDAIAELESFLSFIESVPCMPLPLPSHS